ncbi:CLUMA_CG010522, isoform A [Clunio marinus]|uniref:CLUMA_CG010522, isoform A n=1 Tax=Clunio marinus TaxID=568069 RepID=A0A1J1IA14_9DIPT|nr:CLUMA_CG010522, isoform A [Clunio marinus]
MTLKCEMWLHPQRKKEIFCFLPECLRMLEILLFQDMEVIRNCLTCIALQNITEVSMTKTSLRLHTTQHNKENPTNTKKLNERTGIEHLETLFTRGHRHLRLHTTQHNKENPTNTKKLNERTGIEHLETLFTRGHRQFRHGEKRVV